MWEKWGRSVVFKSGDGSFNIGRFYIIWMKNTGDKTEGCTHPHAPLIWIYASSVKAPSIWQYYYKQKTFVDLHDIYTSVGSHLFASITFPSTGVSKMGCIPTDMKLFLVALAVKNKTDQYRLFVSTANSRYA